MFFASFIRPLVNYKPKIKISIQAEASGSALIEGRIVDQGGVKEQQISWGFQLRQNRFCRYFGGYDETLH